MHEQLCGPKRLPHSALESMMCWASRTLDSGTTLLGPLRIRIVSCQSKQTEPCPQTSSIFAHRVSSVYGLWVRVRDVSSNRVRAMSKAHAGEHKLDIAPSMRSSRVRCCSIVVKNGLTIPHPHSTSHSTGVLKQICRLEQPNHAPSSTAAQVFHSSHAPRRRCDRSSTSSVHSCTKGLRCCDGLEA